jgi:hypothetical protein
VSWEQLISIRDAAIEEGRADREEPPAACPNDGEPLRAGPNGVLFCISDGWQWPRDAMLSDVI